MSTLEVGSLLIVDDNEMNRDMLSRRLSRRGYQVTVAVGGTEAIAILSERVFDAVLLDIMMPEVSGWDVLEWIRERFNGTQLPVIMATAKDSSEDVVRALTLGANDYVTKPLDLKVVVARVSTHVALKRSIDSLESLNATLQDVNADLSAANVRMKEDLTAAAEIQQSHLPSQHPGLAGCDVAWAYKPCDELAGDFLNVFELDDENIGMYLLDVVGHGVTAALMSVAVCRALMPNMENTGVISQPVRKGRKIVSVDITSPADVAAKLNDRFPSDPESGQFFTLIYAILNRPKRQLTFACAGHLPPVILRSNQSLEVPDIKPAFPIGLIDSKSMTVSPYANVNVSLASGDRVYLLSDGVPEALTAEGQLFGDPRLQQSIRESASATLDDSVRNLLDAVLRWCEPRTPTDDVSILAFQMK